MSGEERSSLIGHHATPYLAMPRLCEGCMEEETPGRFCRGCAEIDTQLERRYEDTLLSRMMSSLPREQCGVVEHEPERCLLLMLAIASLCGAGMWLLGIELVRLVLRFSK